MTETQWQAQIITAAELLGWSVYHVTNVRRRLRSRTSVGFPDLVLAHPDHGLLFRELKTEDGRLSTGQATWLGLLDRTGADAAVWRPSDWPEVERTLRGGAGGGAGGAGGAHRR